MSTTTTKHAIRKAAGSDAPSIANAMLGFDDVDVLAPWYGTPAPTNVNGQVWMDSTTGIAYMGDGSGLHPMQGGQIVLKGFMTVGSIPPATAVVRTYKGSFTVTPSAANWTQTISGLSIPAFAYGYVASVSVGDNASSLGQATIVVAACSLTQIGGQAWTTAGAAVSAVVRINFDITGA